MDNNTTVQPNETRLSPAPAAMLLASLLLWGWQTNFLVYAFVMGIILEVPRIVSWRFDFSDKDINQLADLSGVIFFITIVYVFFNYSFQGIYKILELLPFSLFLLMVAQCYSVSNSIKTSALFISIRRMGEKADPDVLYPVNISLPYVFICLISASSGHRYSDVFFVLCSSIIIWMMWGFRSRHFHVLIWILPIIFAVSLSYVTQHGIKRTQANVEVLFLELFERYGWRSRDPERASTAIGSLGRLKLSDRIVFRVKSQKQLPVPMYFGEVSYSNYDYGIWRNPKVEFDVINKTPGKKEWLLDKNIQDNSSVDVGIYFSDQSSIIPVPETINSLSGKDIIQVETNPFGATRVDARKGWVNYRMGFADKKIVETAPLPEDRLIPLNYHDDFKLVASELELYEKSPSEIVRTIQKYFKDNFYYSVTQNQRYTKGQYLTKFLFKDKKGHCEYFATATALLLREAGIPARYTIGYSVQEYSNWQRMYLVRARHAHSWVKYFVNGEWHTLDTTPSTWAPLEAEDRTFLEPVMDLFSWLRYQMTGTDIETTNETNNWILWLLFPLAGYLVWRFYHKQRVTNDEKVEISLSSDIQRYGIDSPAYTLIKQLELEADQRQTGETLINWIKRILPEDKQVKYFNIIKLHNRYRFKPNGDKTIEKKRLIEAINHLT